MSDEFTYKWGSDSDSAGIIATEIDSVDISMDTVSMGAQGSIGTIDLSPYTFNWNNAGYSVTAGSTASVSQYYTMTGTNGINGFKGIEVKDGADIKIGERSLSAFMDKVESRLAILQPKPELLEKFEALQQAYDHYKLLEALCTGDIPNAPPGHV